jgi:hypothetical protein
MDCSTTITICIAEKNHSYLLEQQFKSRGKDKEKAKQSLQNLINKALTKLRENKTEL